jgi:hypothetical protein
MFYTKNRFATANVVLATAVADDGTLDVAYPAGTSQLSFNTGLAGSSYVMLDDNDKLAEGDPGISVSYGASNITVTNKSGYAWPAGTNLEFQFDQQDGNDVILLSIPVKLAAITGAMDVVTEVRPGVYGKIESWEFLVTAPVTTAAKLATLNLEIDTANVTAGTIALTSAAATPLGKSIPGALITGANTLVPESKLSVEASAVTAFAEGEGVLLLRIRKDKAYA